MTEELWPCTILAALDLRAALKEKVKIAPFTKMPALIAAADAAFSGDFVLAAASLYRFPGLVLIRNASATEKTLFQYAPGFLAFREGKAIIEAVSKLEASPDVLLIDGHGIAHPEGIGIASHIGVLLNIPTVGCAKSRLVGDYQEPGPDKGEWSYLFYRGTKVGAVLRTRDNVRPVFVSPGHLVDIESAVRIVMSCVLSFRIPEPLRTADRLSKNMKRDYSEGLH
jgi:deoxyribonuclease V